MATTSWYPPMRIALDAGEGGGVYTPWKRDFLAESARRELHPVGRAENVTGLEYQAPPGQGWLAAADWSCTYGSG
jgi:hypothetical protein